MYPVFLYIILGWYHHDDLFSLGWKYCLLFKLRKKNLFWTNKEFVYLIFINKLSWYYPKIKYKNIEQKVMNKFYENLPAMWTNIGRLTNVAT